MASNHQFTATIFCITICLTLAIITAKADNDDDHVNDNRKRYSNTWVVKISGGKKRADTVAEKLGYVNLGQISNLDYYNFKHKKVPSRSRRSVKSETKKLSEDPEVDWAEQELIKYRYKREANVDFNFNDALWPAEWYLHDTRAIGYDINVLPVWKRNISGKGVVVTILDDGLEHNHDDIALSYDQRASFDYNDYDPDPQPRYDFRSTNRHGTRCAGEIAMKPNNKKCGVGIAFGAKIGGIRMLDGRITDAVEASSLGHENNYVDIYSSSWGPNDNGRVVDGPGEIVMEVLRKGVMEGRRGLGSIYVWASGNGGRRGDNCNCDGYVNSIYTFAISSASYNGTPPWYGEDCTPAIASTFSSGADAERKVASIDLRNGCTTGHTGTSASAPMAAGIYALVLEANPKLTWRDLQHATVWTSGRKNLTKQGWATNGAKREYHHKFGFGVIDAAALVDIVDPAKWKQVPQYRMCRLETYDKESIFAGTNPLRIEIETDGCENSERAINYIEHVQLISTIDVTTRGALQITLISPSGTRSDLLTKRPRDTSRSGFKNWPFMSTHFWGENPRGTWTVELRNHLSDDNIGMLHEFTLVFHGTETMPDVMKRVLDSNKAKKASSVKSSQDKTQTRAATPNRDNNGDMKKSHEYLRSGLKYGQTASNSGLATKNARSRFRNAAHAEKLPYYFNAYKLYNRTPKRLSRSHHLYKRS